MGEQPALRHKGPNVTACKSVREGQVDKPPAAAVHRPPGGQKTPAEHEGVPATAPGGPGGSGWGARRGVTRAGPRGRASCTSRGSLARGEPIALIAQLAEWMSGGEACGQVNK